MTLYPAPAKLNLFLHVVGQRADGYHLLQTVFRFIAYCDYLRFQIREDGVINRSDTISDIDVEKDLCVRAAKLLQQASGTRLGADISLEKNIPIGGGLGGGSSDAATVLIALNRLWDVNFNREQLQRLGLQLGADVPVFIFGQSAFAEGIGERLSPMDLPPAWYVVLTPGVAVSTAKIFANPELTRNTNPIRISDFSIDLGHNDLEPVVCRSYPEIERHLAWLKRFSNAAMTGSGSCVFAKFTNEADARAVLAQLPPDMRGFVAQGLDQHPLWSLLN